MAHDLTEKIQAAEKQLDEVQAKITDTQRTLTELVAQGNQLVGALNTLRSLDTPAVEPEVVN